MNEQKTTPHTHFGFRSVPEEEKQGMVRGVFDSVASRYDLMNDLMSAGLHRAWKNRFVNLLHLPLPPSSPASGSDIHVSPPPSGGRVREGVNASKSIKVLDMASGTGDIAFRIHSAHPEAEIILCDINAAMLHEGKARAMDKNILLPSLQPSSSGRGGIAFACANAETLPFPDRSFDAYTIAFGIRNVTHIEKALTEAYRVLKPGGQFLCLEFSPVENPLIKPLYDAYSFNIIPPMGKYITGDAEAYQYLVESIRRFPTKQRFKSMIEQAGFWQSNFHSLQFGAVAIHTGWRI